MSDLPQNPTAVPSGKGDWSARSLSLLALFTVFAFLLMGYHPGLEDDVFYLAAIKRNLNPSLFPHDTDFFRIHFQATIFDKLIAFSVRLSHLPLAWALLLWQLAAIFLILHGCWRISRRCFSDSAAQWAAVVLVASLLTLPVTGTGINLADPYLHPRNLVIAAILAAVVNVLDRRTWRAGLWLAVAFSIHAIMAAFGISLCGFLLWKLMAPSRKRQFSIPGSVALAIPLGWMFERGSDAWHQAAATRSFYFLARWEWYEWLGVFAPIILLYAFHQWHRRRVSSAAEATLSMLTSSLVSYGIFQTVVGLAIMLPPSLERLRPFEPMRYLHLIYLFFFLIVGGLLGQYVLDRRVYRWLLLFVPISAGMFYAQRQLYPATPHFELPGAVPQNPWLQAFAWVRQNTPVDALFALDPHYMTLPGEDYHGFRALAERSMLADYEKDGGMAARVPRLAPRWLKEVTAETGWRSFQLADFEGLKQQFGVNWVILSHSDASVPNGIGMPANSHGQADMTCPYQNQQVSVCRLY